MKAMAHFAAGVGIASCLPPALPAGLSGNPLYLVLGGCCGLLPDVLETWGRSFVCRHDATIVPDPLRPDPAVIAEGIREVVQQAVVTRRPLMVQLQPCRPAAQSRHCYQVRFDVAGQQVAVRYGAQGRADSREQGAVRSLDCPVRLGSRATAAVAADPGMTLRVAPLPSGGVHLTCHPWHRTWTHSWPVAAAAGLLAAGVWGLAAGLTALCTWAAHIGLDLLDNGAANPRFPFFGQPRHGLRSIRAGNALLNLVLCWGVCLLIFWNAGRFTETSPFPNPLRIFFMGLLLPLGGYVLLRRLRPGRRP